MVILITGTSHTGKTKLAQSLLEKYKYPYLSIDHLKMGLIRSKNTTLTVEDDEALTEYLWKIIKEIIKTNIENKQNIIIEGCYIPFDWKKDFEEESLKEIQYVCLIMTEEYIKNNYQDIIKYENIIEQRKHPESINIDNLIEENRYNLIYCQQPVGGLFGRLLAKKFKIPCIYTAHGFHFFKGAPLKNNLIFKPVEKYLAKYTDVLITINEEDYQAAKKMKAKKVFKIHGIGFVNKTQSEKNVDQIREELGIGKQDFVLISVGELNENKNHLAVLKAVADLNLPNFTYVICGQGTRRQEYETFIAKHNLQNVVKLLGFRKDVQDVLKASDAFIMPSFREGLPMSMMEAMNLGLPILASNIRGCKDLVAVERNGFLFEPTNIAQMKEQILKLYKNKNLCEKIRKNNLEDIKQYSVENVKKELNEIYKEV